MGPCPVKVTSTTSDGEASEQRPFMPCYHTSVSAYINREQLGTREVTCVPRLTEQHHDFVNREQREITLLARLNETWRLIHNIVGVKKGLWASNGLQKHQTSECRSDASRPG